MKGYIKEKQIWDVKEETSIPEEVFGSIIIRSQDDSIKGKGGLRYQKWQRGGWTHVQRQKYYAQNFDFHIFVSIYYFPS